MVTISSVNCFLCFLVIFLYFLVLITHIFWEVLHEQMCCKIANCKIEEQTSPCTGMQDVVRRYKETHADFSQFADKVVFQLNDTHPTISVPELMRVLMDENSMGWTEAWGITSKVPLLTPHCNNCEFPVFSGVRVVSHEI